MHQMRNYILICILYQAVLRIIGSLISLTSHWISLPSSWDTDENTHIYTAYDSIITECNYTLLENFCRFLAIVPNFSEKSTDNRNFCRLIYMRLVIYTVEIQQNCCKSTWFFKIETIIHFVIKIPTFFYFTAWTKM